MPGSCQPPDRRSSGLRSRAARVLVIEDEEDSRELFACELEFSGFLVSTAANGEEGLERVRRFEPDVIVLDLILPGLSGFSVAHTARGLECGRNVAIVAVSGLTSETLRIEALGAGCDVFLRKPVAPPTVVKEVRHLLARRKVRWPPSW